MTIPRMSSMNISIRRIRRSILLIYTRRGFFGVGIPIFARYGVIQFGPHFSPLSLPPILHHTGNHAITTIAKRSTSAQSIALEKKWNSEASGIRRMSSMMVAESPTERKNARGNMRL